MNPRPLRICHFITSLNVGGAETMLTRLITSSDPQRFSHEVITLMDGGPLQVDLERHGVRVHSLRMARALPSPRALRTLWRLARAACPDIWHGWMYHGNYAAFAAMIADSGRAPVVWGIRHALHRLEDERLVTRGLIALGPRAGSRVARILYNARCSADQHEHLGYPADKTLVIPNGFDCERFRPDSEASIAVRNELGLRPEVPLVGLVARFDPLKGQQFFLEAAARLVANGSPAHFVLVGEDMEAKNKTLWDTIVRLQLAGRVHLLGHRKDIPRLNASFDVAGLTSLSEAFPNMLGEAMACGVVCVVTDVGDSKFILGDNGWVVPPADAHALADAWERVLRLSPQEREVLGASARERILKEFSISAVRQLYETMYEEVASRSPRRKATPSCAE
jgi:glycosyltransferase involved in cell wall biosynthesis